MCTEQFIEYFRNSITEEGKTLINTFFIVFSRFECALKESSFINLRGDKVYANWDRFAISINEVFNRDRTPELNTAVDYLIQNPPRVQSIHNNELIWIDRVFQGNESLVQKLSISIRDVRNNLFHGGKFRGNFEPEVSRNYILLKSSILILSEWLRLSENVRNSFISHDFY